MHVKRLKSVDFWRTGLDAIMIDQNFDDMRNPKPYVWKFWAEAVNYKDAGASSDLYSIKRENSLRYSAEDRKHPSRKTSNINTIPKQIWIYFFVESIKRRRSCKLILKLTKFRLQNIVMVERQRNETFTNFIRLW